MRQNIHFIDNARNKKKGRPNYDHELKELMKGMKQALTAGMIVTINESTIRYCGRAIAFIQYLPAKPIKHGVKVFVLCCSYFAVLLGFEIFVVSVNKEDASSENKDQNTAIDIVKQLIDQDNWYASIKLAKILLDNYHWRWHTCSDRQKFLYQIGHSSSEAL